jgi:hypothetical protein
LFQKLSLTEGNLHSSLGQESRKVLVRVLQESRLREVWARIAIDKDRRIVLSAVSCIESNYAACIAGIRQPVGIVRARQVDENDAAKSIEADCRACVWFHGSLADGQNL